MSGGVGPVEAAFAGEDCGGSLGEVGACRPGHHPAEELRNQVSEVLRRVAAGETLTVTVAGREVAELSSVRKHRWVSGSALDRDDDERTRRTDRLAVVEATFDPLPVSVEITRAWGRLAAAVARRGGKPRRRQLDLAIAATATATATARRFHCSPSILPTSASSKI